jgi:hypothetical protein
MNSQLAIHFEWIDDVVKDAQHRLRRPSKARALDNIEPTSPIMPAVERRN